jgi:uncharacterized protein YeeX (DUF496 family)
MMLDIKDVARDRHKHVMGLNRLKEYINKQMIKKKMHRFTSTQKDHILVLLQK